MEMKKYKLGEIANFVEERISSEDISLDEYVTTDSLLQNKKGRVMAQNLPPKKCSLTYYKKGDVLIGNIRPYLKKIWLADTSGGCSQDVLVLRSKKDSDSEFLYATLMQDDFFDYVMKATKGSKMPRGDKNHIMHFICFDVKNKNKIGELFSSLDKKIALNCRINAYLEQMAKWLYEHYFVQFDFPTEDGKPYKTSGGKMVYSSELKREIPEGWEVKRLGECLKHINTGLNPRDNFKLGNGNIKYITVKNLTVNGIIDFSGCDLIDENARLIVHERSQITKGNILFASISPLGRCYIIQEEPKDWDINESVFAISPNQEILSSEYLYCYLTSQWFMKKAEKEATGSIFAGIRMAALNAMPVIVPDKDTLQLFTNYSKSIFQQKDKLFKENEYLTSLRDRLLPLLMNGQVSV